MGGVLVGKWPLVLIALRSHGEDPSHQRVRSETSAISAKALEQRVTELDEFAPACLNAPEFGGEVVDRSAAAAGEAGPASRARRVDVEAWALVGWKGQWTLRPRTALHAEQRFDVGRWRAREECVACSLTARRARGAHPM